MLFADDIHSVTVPNGVFTPDRLIDLDVVNVDDAR